MPAQTDRDGDAAGPAAGSYLLVITLPRDVSVRIGALGAHRLNEGTYLYVGSAKRGIESRVERHRRLARLKRGPSRWHIDFVLMDRHAAVTGSIPYPGIEECTLSRAVASVPGAGAPVAGFGSSDCTNGCRAHFYRLPSHPVSIQAVARAIWRGIASPGNPA